MKLNWKCNYMSMQEIKYISLPGRLRFWISTTYAWSMLNIWHVHEWKWQKVLHFINKF